MSSEQKYTTMLQTFSISTLASCVNAFQNLGVSDGEISFISELKRIFIAGHSIKVRTDLNGGTRTYEVAYDSGSHNSVALLREETLKKNQNVQIAMTNYSGNHELRTTFEISQTDVICIPGSMGMMGVPGKNGVTYEEVVEKLRADKYIFNLSESAGSSESVKITLQLEDSTTQANDDAFNNVVGHSRDFSIQPFSASIPKTETLSDKPKFVKIQSDTGEVSVFPEEVLLTLTNIRIENTTTAGIQLLIFSEQLSKEFELSFSSLQKAKNTLNRICKKYVSTKTI
jgi:hypothetical protein